MPSIDIEFSTIDKAESSRKLYYFKQNSNDLNKTLSNGDHINIASSQKTVAGSIILKGEVVNPGEYVIQRGDTILNILNRAGGYTKESYSQGSVFLRKSVAEMQKQAFLRSAEQLELTLIDTITQGELVVSNQFSLAPLTELITRLREEEPLGRQVVDLDYLSLKTDPFINFPVQDGDELFVPKRPYSVSVVGEVLNSSTLPFSPNLNIADYIELAGGLNENADRKKIFIIFPDGKSKLAKRNLFSQRDNVLPGSTIVISRDSKPWDAIKLTSIVTPILADLATSAAAIAAISNN
jgi:protein involved in polysaccharide export with SLBB domain